MNTHDFSLSRRHGLLLPRRDAAWPRRATTLLSRVSGHFVMEAVRPDGSRRFLAEFDNLVTDVGLERWGTGGIIGFCRVGTGSSEPSYSNTALDAQLAWTSTTTGSTTGAQASAPYFGWYTVTYRFAAGAATGNLSEVGVGWASTGATLWSRALIVDGGGSPTTITVLPDEVLDVTYTLRLYPPLADTSFALTMSGVDYDVTARAAFVVGANQWSPDPTAAIGARSGHSGVLYTGGLGAITASPSGTSSPNSNFGTAQAYSAGSKQRVIRHFFDLLYGNVGTVLSAYLTSSLGVYQFQFSPTFVKNGLKQLTLDLRVSWARH